ncbi:MAG: helix-turn-helix domain-containing protein [Oscillospiraceae bacterium]|nr:helix-turn-helix domain-containing protein [Oscillospiraceae bacterium]
MSNASRALIEEAVNVIESKLKEPLSLDVVSGHLHLSKYHLHRLFRSLTGQPMMTYVRGRRLSSSTTELLETDLRIIDIAAEYRFTHEQSYERAFKRRFGLSPADFRRRRTELSIDQRIDCGLIYDLPQGVLLSPRYCVLSAFCAAGVEELINHRENFEKITANALALKFHTHWRSMIPDRINDHIYYGIISYGEDPDTANYYMPAVEIAREQALPAPFLCRAIPTQTYAVFRYVGFHAPEELSMQNLGALYALIDNIWYAHTSHKQAAPYHFERMDLRNCSPTYCETDIYIPIKG